jgi:hypothetical protein
VNGNNSLVFARSRIPAFADVPQQSVSTLISLTEGSFVQAIVSHNSGAELEICGTLSHHCHLAMHWVGPA